MSAHMRKRPTKKAAHLTWHGNQYEIPLQVLEQYKIEDNNDPLSVEEVFSELISEIGEPAVLLKGLREKESLSQVAFAKAIKISQSNLSAMENGRRGIGKDIAKRIEKKFGVDYRLFLG